MVKVSQDGNPNLLEISKAGPSAISASEIPILRTLHEVEGGGDNACSIERAKVVGEFESTQKNEFERLCGQYGGPVVNTIYPGGRGLAKTLADCELPKTALAPADKKTTAPVDQK